MKSILQNIGKGLAYIFGFLLICAIGYIVFLHFNPKVKYVYLQTKPTIKIVYVERSDSTVVAKSTIPKGDFAEQMIDLEKTKEMYERLIPEIKDHKKEVAVLTEVRSTVEGTLREKDIIIDDLKRQLALQEGKPVNSTTWKGKYMTITHNVDSQSVDYKYDNVVQLAITSPKNNRDSVSVFASSPDKENKINGMDTYVQKFIIPKRFSELVLDGSLGKLNFNNDWSNINNYSIDGRVKWKFNPDGKFRPYIFVGANTDFARVYYPFGIGTEFKIK